MTLQLVYSRVGRVAMKTERLQVRIDPTELDLIKQAADHAHMSVSEFARLMLLIGSRGTLSVGAEEIEKTLGVTSFMLFGRTIPREDWEKMKEHTD